MSLYVEDPSKTRKNIFEKKKLEKRSKMCFIAVKLLQGFKNSFPTYIK